MHLTSQSRSSMSLRCVFFVLLELSWFRDRHSFSTQEDVAANYLGKAVMLYMIIALFNNFIHKEYLRLCLINLLQHAAFA